MTDPERISHRSSGLAAELLRAGAAEEPRSAGVERTLAALGVSGALLTTAATASGVAAGGGAAAAGAATVATGAKAVKAVSALLLAKWIGVGVVGGVGLAGAAAVVSRPLANAPSATPAIAAAPRTLTPARVAPSEPVVAPQIAEPPPEVVEPSVTASPMASLPVPKSEPALDIGAPLAAEVAFIDRARGLLAAGQAEQGLQLLSGYEQQFPEARLLPEVLFLRLETCDRLGRRAEARSAAQRLVEGFPKSPHAARARQLLNP
jgi:hypothetical protein